jgi:hypothetical protein
MHLAGIQEEEEEYPATLVLDSGYEHAGMTIHFSSSEEGCYDFGRRNGNRRSNSCIAVTHRRLNAGGEMNP